jgi:membrane protein implicated in regulation of membrane protease activity
MSINLVWLWLLTGIALCAIELVLPTAFVSFAMGVSAVVVAIAVPILPHLGLQVVVWLALSTAFVFLSRRLIPAPQRHSKIRDATVAETLTEITAGKEGRVLYEGNSWRAKCADEKLSILPQQKVYVVSREGTTLIVMPESLIHH